MRRGPLLSCFALLFSLLVSSPVTAEEDAQARFERGQRYYDLGRYPEAIREFEEGYLLTGLPAFLLNIAQAYRLSGEDAKAAEYYRRFLDKAEADDPARPSAEKILAELRAKGPATPTSLQAPPPAQAPPIEPRPASKRRWLWIGAGGGVGLIVLVALLSRSDESPTGSGGP